MKIKACFFGPLRRPWPETSKELEIPEGLNVAGLLTLFGYVEQEARRIAVVIDGKKVPLNRELSENDEVRLVLFAGGG